MTTEAIAIRPARPGDVASVLDFWRESAYGASPTDDEDAVAALLARDSDALLLAIDSRHIVGSVIAGWDGWRGNLYRLAVLPSERRNGIGALLVREAEKRLHACGARRISALVESDNDRARPFWHAQGYEIATTQLRYYKDLP